MGLPPTAGFWGPGWAFTRGPQSFSRAPPPGPGDTQPLSLPRTAAPANRHRGKADAGGRPGASPCPGPVGGAMKDVGGSESLSVPSSPSLRPPSVSPRGPARVPDARAGEGDPADLPRSAPPPAASSPAQQESGSARGSRRSWTGSSAALTPYSRREEGTCSPFQRPGRLLGPLTHRAGSSTRTEREDGGLAPAG